MDEHLKERLTEQSTWLRALYMLLFAVIFSITELVIAAVVILQFLTKLFSGKVNQQLLTLAQSLGTYVYDIVIFMGYNSEEKPFPFAPWPQGAPGQERAPEKGQSAAAPVAKKQPKPKPKPAPEPVAAEEKKTEEEKPAGSGEHKPGEGA